MIAPTPTGHKVSGSILAQGKATTDRNVFGYQTVSKQEKWPAAVPIREEQSR